MSSISSRRSSASSLRYENGGSASSSRVSLDPPDEENDTITNHKLIVKHGKQKSTEDLKLLAVSTHITELSYSISDIQTRIFEIQELRHKSQSSVDHTATTSVIDQSLMTLDERLETVSKGIKSVEESLSSPSSTPTRASTGENPNAALLRKHATLKAEWEAVQDESEVLREELKEDKWLTVFRTVTDQADGMMSSLEKAVNRCQDFIWQVHRKGPDRESLQADATPLTFEVFTSLLDSFEAKKKHYMPATSKVLSIIDKGVQDRVTKNGETLRRHAESAQRWQNLKDKIVRTETEMEGVRNILLSNDNAVSEAGSSVSGVSTRNGYLATPPDRSSTSRAASNASTLSRSISPFRKFARKFTGSVSKSPATPVTTNRPSIPRMPSSEPVPTLRRQRTSLFSFRGNAPPSTPERPTHKYSQSLTPESSPASRAAELRTAEANSALKARTKQRWNASTKVELADSPSKISPSIQKRPPSAAGTYSGRPPSSTGYFNRPPSVSSNYGTPAAGSTIRNRAASRQSMSAVRPRSPASVMASRYVRPPSRSQTPTNLITGGISPRSRPKTPSHIPAPAKIPQWRSAISDNGLEDDEHNSMSTNTVRTAFSPSQSTSTVSSHHQTPSRGPPPPRPPSRSQIPIPSLQFSAASRPSSSMSDYKRAQTPESALKARAGQIPMGGTLPSSVIRMTPTRPAITKLPPSSFRDGQTQPPTRPSSRNGGGGGYVPGNSKDPLDVEVATIVNSVAHGLLIERVDPPLRMVPKEGEEIRAQYAFSNALARKVVTCRLTTHSRSGGTGTAHKKVMCRVGGGWQDLQLYMLNRQAGM